MSRWLFEKLKAKAEARSKPSWLNWNKLSWKEALEVCSSIDLKTLEKEDYIIIRSTRGGKYIEW